MIERLRAAWLGFLHPELLEIRDPLTGALMPREFTRLAKRVINRAQKGGQIISLVYIDIDGLKEINDTWGHKVGNCFIKKLAQAIFTNIRPFDICGRWHGEGGDEFVLLLPGASLNNAREVAERIQGVFSSFSWGSTQLIEKDSIEGMVRRAEQIMYVQKRYNKVTKK